MPAAARLRPQGAFTLIELLVVILVIGILVAVAAPSFLGQTQKAEDSAAKQYLTVAYKAAKAYSVDGDGAPGHVQGSFTGFTAAKLVATEPGLTAAAGSCPADAAGDPHTHITIAQASGSNLTLCNDPEGRVWTLRVENGVLKPLELCEWDGSQCTNQPAAAVPVAAPVNSALPQISGTTTVGSTLTTSNGTWSSSPTSYSYQWLRCTDDVSTSSCANIAAATANTHQAASADAGKYLRAVVRAINAGAPTGVAATSEASADIRATITETPVTLTTSGGLITDAVRSSGVEGDGRVADSSFGAWEATTNLIANGGFETNTNGSGGNTNAGVSQLATDAKYGSKSLRVEQAAAGNFSAYLSGNLAVSPSTTYTASLWVKDGTGTAPIAISVGLHNGAAYTLFDATPYTAPTGSWVRRTHTFTTAADTTTVRVFVATSSTAGTGNTFYVDGVQLEQQPLATPYVETSSATAARAAGRIQGPASVLNASQGWLAMRVRANWASSSPPHTYSTVFTVGDTSDDGLYLYYTGGYWGFERYSNGTGTQLYHADSFARGDTVTIVARWTADKIAVSIDGSPFTVQNNANVPTLATSSFDIGAAGIHCCISSADSDIFWTAIGTGALSDSQAGDFNAYTDPPNLGMMPGTATFRWTADNATAYVR